MDASIEHEVHVDSGEAPKSQAEEAAGLFVQASIRFPGLTEPSAAWLALKCQELKLDPRDLKEALLAESGRTADITQMANRMHDKHRPKDLTIWQRVTKAVKDYLKGVEDPPVLTEKRVREVIDGTFELAGDRMGEDPAKLKEIIALAPNFKNKRKPHRERFEAYGDKVGQILKRQEVNITDPASMAGDKSIRRRVLTRK